MKKIILTLGIICLALVSCNKTETVPNDPNHLSFNITVNDLTKATKTEWENGDRIILFFDREIVSTPRYVTMSYDGTKWDYAFNEGTLEAELLGKASGTVSAVFVPYWSTFSTSYFTGWGYPAYYLRFWNEAGIDDVWCYFLRCQDADYSVSAGVISASLTLTQPGAPNVTFDHIFIPGITGNERYTLEAPNLLKVQTCVEYSLDNISQQFRGGVAGYGEPIPGYEYKGGVSFSGYFENHGIPDDYTFTLVDTKGTANTSDDDSYQISFTGKTIPDKGAIQLPALSSWNKL